MKSFEGIKLNFNINREGKLVQGQNPPSYATPELQVLFKIQQQLDYLIEELAENGEQSEEEIEAIVVEETKGEETKGEETQGEETQGEETKGEETKGEETSKESKLLDFNKATMEELRKVGIEEEKILAILDGQPYSTISVFKRKMTSLKLQEYTDKFDTSR